MKKLTIILSVCLIIGCGVLVYTFYFQKQNIKELALKEIEESDLNRGKNSGIVLPEEVYKISKEIWISLYSPKKMIIYSLDPEINLAENKDGPGFFHEYVILGSTEIINPNDKIIIANEIKNAYCYLSGGNFLCFDPRHGVRIESEKATFDFLICYSCCAMHVYSGNNLLHSPSIGGNKKVLNDILKRANIPLAKDNDKLTK